MKLKIAVLFGGKSVEHEISIISALQAVQSINKEKYDIVPVYIAKDSKMYIGKEIGVIESYKNIPKLIKSSQRVMMINDDGKVFLENYPIKRFGKNEKMVIDMAFPIVHGTNVEDGTLQGYLKTLGIPFVGCDVTSSVVGMDKFITKAILKEQGIPVLPYKIFTVEDYIELKETVNEIETAFDYPVIVKPVNLGSSVGISIAKNREELISGIDDGFLYAKRIIVEKAVMNLREINCSVLGDEELAEASVCEEPLRSDEILSYKDKYMSGSKGSKSGSGSKGMASVSRKIPAEISAEMTKNIQNWAVKAFKVFGANGVARIDFILDEDSGQVYFNEMNTIPGSLSFYLWEASGITYEKLLDRMIELSLKRQRKEESLTFTFDTNVLSSVSLSGGKNGVKN